MSGKLPYSYYNWDPVERFASLKRLDVELLNPHGSCIESYRQLLSEAHIFAAHSYSPFHDIYSAVGNLMLKGASHEMRTVPGAIPPDRMKKTWTLRYEAE
jgi:hypothetical protein